ncbi:hypothetical protein DICPUDRAFT_78609 [Dictyostelium purpureum]|uniref:IPT/TIG domain-containing protein n=1 Tax=Dictyostelium purpureum TaxID=5786 RepID=F0ZK22_DICPU|nr:uncharacterized protein DICPUDRAFT_78609 [Dictyostelium purpureum]EGC35714.1 hypothetical protein DICPUDRAFT_78609 [Dictyostelium purpureum]|eukprot:XP_003287770.1 hypothetical protein DICPUDRAFT_78609 [Dictyostelium purpureum]
MFILSNCNEFDINKSNKSPIITSVESQLITEDSTPHLNVYVNGIFSQKKMNLTVFLNDEVIENIKYQHDNNKNNSSPDSVSFKLYREDIVPGNITLEYSDTEFKSNKMPLELDSITYRTQKPDVTGGVLTIIGNYYYVNYTAVPKVQIGKKECQVLQYDNAQIKCLVDSSFGSGDIIEIGNVYNYQNKTLEFQFKAPTIDRVLNVDRIQESVITIIGKNFNEKQLEELKIYVKEDSSNTQRDCSKAILITNSVIICNLNKSLSHTSKGDTLFLMLNNAKTPSADFNLMTIENQQDKTPNKESNDIIDSNKYLLLAIIIPTLVVFIFTIVLIIFIFKKRNQSSYFNLMSCNSNELQETSYY